MFRRIKQDIKGGFCPGFFLSGRDHVRGGFCPGGFCPFFFCPTSRSQQAQVRWGSHISDSFYIRNGVRQGGILSPMLFNLYVDGLSRSLNSLNIGCKIGPRLVNHLAYADDLVLICPSVKVFSVLSMYVKNMVIVTTLHIIARKLYA